MPTEDSHSDNETTACTEMSLLKIDPIRASTLLQNISSIHNRITSTYKSTSASVSHPPPRLVAVSKLKPAADILALHRPTSHTADSVPDASSVNSQIKSFLEEADTEVPEVQVHFGENYVQELIQKSKILPRSIRWHFIGGLQSNKCLQLARDVVGLWAVESVDSEKKARQLDKGWGQRDEAVGQNGQNGQSEDGSEEDDKRLRIFIQVNTSGEQSKSGLEPKCPELLKLAKLIRSDELPNLKLQGLMTIGAIARSKATTSETENEDFISLRDNREWLAEELGLDKEDGEEELELSMGMSEDFEGAIRLGSGEVRVGSTIFGERPPRKEAKILEGVEEGREKWASA